MTDASYQCITCKSHLRQKRWRTPSVLVYPPVPLLNLDALRKLPEQRFSHAAGVYFVWRKETLYYIGSAFDFARRLKNHEKIKEGDVVTCLTVNPPYHLAVEHEYIGTYWPVGNRKKMEPKRLPGGQSHASMFLQPEWLR